MFTSYELDWSRVPEWANWVAQDADGAVYAYEYEPRTGRRYWLSAEGEGGVELLAARPEIVHEWAETKVARPPILAPDASTVFDTTNPGLVPFKDLPESARIVYMHAFLAGRLQALAGHALDDEWFKCMSLQPGAIVRIAPPSTKPSIDWSHVASEYRYLARDGNGCVYLYVHRPLKGLESWRPRGEYFGARAFASYTPGSCDWKDSLVERPEDQ